MSSTAPAEDASVLAALLQHALPRPDGMQGLRPKCLSVYCKLPAVVATQDTNELFAGHCAATRH